MISFKDAMLITMAPLYLEIQTHYRAKAESRFKTKIKFRGDKKKVAAKILKIASRLGATLLG